MKQEIPWDLIIRKLRQTTTAADERLFADWMEEESHEALFAELAALWQKIQQRSGNYTPDAGFYWQELSRRMQAAGKPAPRRRRLPGLWRYVAAASLLLLVALSATFYLGQRLSHTEALEQTYTNLNGKSKMNLPDGSEVWLDTRSSLAYATDFLSDTRAVEVSGQAYFDVAHDAGRPFVVRAGGVEVIVHGTRFNVEAFPEADDVFVSLLEGSVELSTSKEKRFLSPGEMATFDKRNQQLTIERGDVHFQSSWAQDNLMFKEKPLGYVCHSLSRWYHTEIRLSPELSDRYLYTFTLRNEPLEEILRLMARINPIRYSFDEHNVVTISPSRPEANRTESINPNFIK